LSSRCWVPSVRAPGQDLLHVAHLRFLVHACHTSPFSAPSSLLLKPSPRLLAPCGARGRAPCDPPLNHQNVPSGARQHRMRTSEERDVPAPHGRGCCDVRCLAARRHQEARPCEHVDGFRRRRAVVVPDKSSKTGQVSQWMQTQVGMPDDPRVRARGGSATRRNDEILHGRGPQGPFSQQRWLAAANPSKWSETRAEFHDPPAPHPH